MDATTLTLTLLRVYIIIGGETDMKITKKEWVRLGGLRNTNLYRNQVGNRWVYYKGATE